MKEKYIEEIKRRFKVELKNAYDGLYYFKSGEVYIHLVEPHSGTDYKYLLRADFPETFDRWSNCLWEELFKLEDIGKELGKLEEFIKNKEDIVKDELS